MQLRRAGPSGLAAASLYLAIALAFTWPLAAGLTRDIPWDLGDSLLNAWILAWDADHLLRFLSGDFGALRGFWNANIFHPERLTLAYSEHLFAQAVQILPVYALTGNIILAYNLLFLSTFVLSGLGAFLFVREVTGSARAGFVAGTIYAFAPYRVPQFAHLQVISSQWMPFALYGLRRHFDAYTYGRSTRLPLIGAGTALVAQNLSNGYFVFYFSPFVAAYAVFEIATRKLWRDTRVWGVMAATAAAVTLLTLPFLWPYLELRRLGSPARTLAEVLTYSADVYSYWTAPPESHMWGRTMRAFPKPEGDLFPTLTALALAAVGVAACARSAWKTSRDSVTSVRGLNGFVYLLLGILAAYAVLLLLVFTGSRIDRIGPLPISVRGIGRPSLVLALVLILLLAVSPRARLFARAWLGTVAMFAALSVAAAFVLSLGPHIRTAGRLIGETGPYSLLYAHVPGFDGLRVPARYAMIAMLFLATTAGFGAAVIERRFRRGGAITALLAVLVLSESYAAPIIINGSAAEGGYLAPPPRVYTGTEIPSVYRFLKTLPAPGTVLVEFPFGEWGYEVRYMFYSTNHWHPLLNGYSGMFPLSYNLRGVLLRHPLESPDLAWKTLLEDGATHAVVHHRLYKDGEAVAISQWLAEHGAKPIAEFDGDAVFSLR
ncbi:MAG TPA: hypothetical protein VJM31_18445 [Vicinamibacterales bacterium]|nr:hypothetical protein [Vicinamibacterales bacterium]